MNSYTIDYNGGPIFERKHIDGIPYITTNPRKAATVSDAKFIIDNVFQNMHELLVDLSMIRGNISDLAANWNKFLTVNNKKSEFVIVEDLFNDISSIEDGISNGKEKCDQFLDEYSKIISEINIYINELITNYEEYKKLIDKRNY